MRERFNPELSASEYEDGRKEYSEAEGEIRLEIFETLGLREFELSWHDLVWYRNSLREKKAQQRH
jgi:hypothetical protein